MATGRYSSRLREDDEKESVYHYDSRPTQEEIDEWYYGISPKNSKSAAASKKVQGG